MTNIRISWSALRNHMECHQRSFLQRSGKKAKFQDQRVFFPGTVTDRVVRDWLLNNPEPGIMPDMVEQFVLSEEKVIEEEGKQLRWKNPSDRDFVIQECQQAVRDIEPFLNKYVLPYEYDADFAFQAPINAPHPITGDPSTITLNGFMDIVVRMAPDKWAVYDVKHTKDEYYWKKTRGQLSFYDLAMEIMFGVPTTVTGLLQPLCKDKFKTFVLTEDERTILLKHVIDMANDIWLDNKELTTDPGNCSFCNVKHACSKFTPATPDAKKKVVSLLLPKDQNE
mgnify:CR=1 FL=1